MISPGVAQLVGRLVWDQDAASSSLATRTINGRIDDTNVIDSSVFLYPKIDCGTMTFITGCTHWGQIGIIYGGLIPSVILFPGVNRNDYFHITPISFLLLRVITYKERLGTWGSPRLRAFLDFLCDFDSAL